MNSANTPSYQAEATDTGVVFGAKPQCEDRAEKRKQHREDERVRHHLLKQEHEQRGEAAEQRLLRALHLKGCGDGICGGGSRT